MLDHSHSLSISASARRIRSLLRRCAYLGSRERRIMASTRRVASLLGGGSRYAEPHDARSVRSKRGTSYRITCEAERLFARHECEARIPIEDIRDLIALAIRSSAGLRL